MKNDVFQIFRAAGNVGGGFLPMGTKSLVLFRWTARSSRWATTTFLVCTIFVKPRFLVR